MDELRRLSEQFERERTTQAEARQQQVGSLRRQVERLSAGYFGEVEQRFRGSGTRIPAKWNARRSVATFVGQFPPVRVETGR